MENLEEKLAPLMEPAITYGCVENLFIEPTRRVDLTFGISYDDDILKVKDILRQVIAADERILKTPEADVFASAHADSSINFLVRPWVNSDDYWQVYLGIMEEVKLAFDREGITIPFPQRDVHMIRAE